MEIRFLDSITDVGAGDRGAVVVSGSHGGVYPAALASQAGLHAVIFNDAGGGLEDAGVAGAMALASVGMAAAGVDCLSARIGDARDMAENGRLSRVNSVAADLGVAAGQTVETALGLLATASAPSGMLSKVEEARRIVDHTGSPVLLVDSASLVRPDDEGAVIVTGSHGGLIGGDPARALKTTARLAVFNDAGRGKHDCAMARLPALDQRGVAAVTVAHTSARIGDAASALATGTISQANKAARDLGLTDGQLLSDAIARLLSPS